jgi:hypothetical protein
MIRSLLAVTSVLAWAGPLAAETIVTRSGEHKGFSRLVMRLPDGADWSLTQDGRGATLNLNSADAEFDTSRVFRLIPRQRIETLQQNGPGQPLRIGLGCDCAVTAYVQKDGYLVVDVKDGADSGRTASFGTLPEPMPLNPLGQLVTSNGYRFNLPSGQLRGARAALELAAAVAGRPVVAEREAPALPEPGMPLTLPLVTRDLALNLPSVSAAPDTSVPAPEPEQQASPETAEEADPVPDPAPQTADAGESAPENPAMEGEGGLLFDVAETERATTVGQTEHRLLEQIGRATNQGLLDLVRKEVDGAEADTLLAPLSAQMRQTDPLAHVSVTTSIDRDMLNAPSAHGAPGLASLCLPPSELAVHDWGSEEPFADQVGPLRSSLYGEFDRVDPQTALNLARVYLFFGFGAEARGVLDLVPPELADVEVLRQMSFVMDGDPLPINHIFSGQQGCKSEAAFWAALADGTVKDHADTDQIQQALSRLPIHLRVALGPRVSKFFAKAEEEHMATAALRSIERSGVEDVPEINLAEAAIAEMHGDTETQAVELTEEVAGGTQTAPHALIELIGLSFGERRALSPDVPDLVASYEMENRDGDLGPELRRAEATALAMTGSFDQAFLALADLTDTDGPVARADAVEPVLMMLTERADDVTFLKYGLLFANEATAIEAEPVSLPLARRLLDLGFAEQARELLMKPSSEGPDGPRRLMLAESALEMDKPHRALIELMGMEGSEANKLRARAHWMTGQYREAGEYLMEENEADEAARGFWLSEDLETAASSGETAFAEVAEVTSAIEEKAETPSDMTPLAQARALVESSVGTRDEIAALLSRVRRDDTAGN